MVSGEINLDPDGDLTWCIGFGKYRQGAAVFDRPAPHFSTDVYTFFSIAGSKKGLVGKAGFGPQLNCRFLVFSPFAWPHGR